MKWLKRIAVVLLTLILIGVGVYYAVPYFMKREIKTRLAAIKAKGDPVCVKDLDPHIPNSQNGATLYERVFAITWSGKEDILKANDVTSTSELKKHPELMTLAKNLASKYQNAIPLVEQAAARPRCSLNDQWGLFLFTSQHMKLKNVSRLLSETAISDASEGKMDDSVRAVELGYKVSESLKESPSLIGWLVRISCIYISSTTLKSSAQYHDLSETQARELFELLEKIDLRTGYVKTLKGDRVLLLGSMDDLRKNGQYLDMDMTSAGKRKHAPPIRVRWLENLTPYADEIFYLKYMDKIIDSAGRPSTYRLAKQTEIDLDIPKSYLMSDMVLPIYPKILQKFYEAMATVAGDRSFLAVLAYKAKFGSYPSNLQEVESKLRWKLPMDPMTGSPFHYRREGKGFVMYGLGKNMKDDNAKTFDNPPESVRKAGDNRYSEFLDKYPYTDIDGRRSANMIWRMNR